MNKKVLSYLFPLAAALTISSCIDPSELANLNYNPVDYSPGKQYAGVDQKAYRQGYNYGLSDAKRGQTNNYASHRNAYNSNSLNQFRHGYEVAYRNYMPHHTSSYKSNSYAPSYSNRDYQARATQGSGPLRANVTQGGVRITSGGKKVCFLRTASPNVEKQHFVNNKTQVVVKSRGNHGPATVELFDAHTGVLKGKVLAYAIHHGQPSWARGMQD